MSKILPFDAVPFTNERGDVLNPGDAAIAVTCGMGQASLRVGKYLGVRKRNYYGRDYLSVVMQVHVDTKRLVHKDTGERWDHAADSRKIPRPDYYDKTTWYGLANYYAASNAWYKQITDMQVEQGYVWKDFAEVGHTTLQNNKIYPGNVALVNNVTL